MNDDSTPPTKTRESEPDEAAIRDLAARYLDLWRENWLAFLAPPEEATEDEAQVP